MIASVPGLCILFTYITRVLVVVPCGGPKKSPAHPFNVLILPIIRGCLQSFSMIWGTIASVLGICILFTFITRVIQEFITMNSLLRKYY